MKTLAFLFLCLATFTSNAQMFVNSAAFGGAASSKVSVPPPPAWSPTNTTSSGPAFAWWSVDGAYTTNAGVILADSSGHGFHLSSSNNIAAIPRRIAAGLNGHDYLKFIPSLSGWSEYLTNSSAALSVPQPYDVFLVIAMTNTAPASRRFLFGSGAAAGYITSSLYVNGTGVEIIDGTTYKVSTATITNTWVVLDARISGSSSFIRTNNVAGATGTMLNIPMTNMFCLNGNCTLAQGVDCKIAEVAIFTNMTLVDTTNYYNYLASRYAIVP